MVVLQFLVTPKNGVTTDPAAIAALIRPIRLGTIWTMAAAFTLRHELALSLREKLALVRRAWSPGDVPVRAAARSRRWTAIAVAVVVLFAATVAGAYRFADPERRNMDTAARASAPGQFVHLTDGETHYEIGGPPDAPLVVLAAGMGAPYAAPQVERMPLVWDFLTAVFDERGWADYQGGDLAHPERFPNFPQRYRTQIRYRGFRRAQRSTLVSNDALAQDEEIKRVGRGPLPVIAFWGTEDARVPFETSAVLTAKMPRARVVPVESGHLAHWEQPVVVHAALIAFLRQ